MLGSMARTSLRASTKVLAQATRTALARHKPPPGKGDWLSGVVIGPAGARQYHLYKPPDARIGADMPLMVMLHGCGQDARSFALSTRMNQLAARQGFLVLYPEQNRLHNPQGCWNWYDTDSGRAFSEAATLMLAIDQVIRLHAVDPARVAVAGLSAGASMAALLATHYPGHFRAIIMHSGIAPGTAHSAATVLGAMRGRRSTMPLAGECGQLPPLLVIQGRMDPIVVHSNGQASAQIWAEATGAGPGTPRLVQRGTRYPMTVTDFKRRGRMVASLCEIGILGHAWSGGAAGQPFSDVRGPDASRMAWTFALRQFRAATK